MSAVITEEQARKITGGRKPLVPIEYETACKAIEACTSLDEAKVWDNKADALAAWARIYRDDKVGRQARILKLHAYRRMGLLAKELRPGTIGAVPGQIGASPGPVSLLREAGLPLHKAAQASAISKMTEREFKKAIHSDTPPAPSQLMPKYASDKTEAWKALAGNYGGTSLLSFKAFCRSHSPKRARELALDEAAKAREAVAEIADWLDEFERFLPKEKK